MKQTKPVYSFDDLLELLAEHAIGTDAMKEIEEFCQRRKHHTDYLVRRLRNAEQIIGSNLLDEHMMYD